MLTPDMIMNDITEYATIPRLFLYRAECLEKKRFLNVMRDRQTPLALTWGEVAEAVRARAAWLQAKGLRAGERVVLVSENSVEWIVTHLATLACGGVVAPQYANANFADWDRSVERLTPRFIFASEACLARWPGATERGAHSLSGIADADPKKFDPTALSRAEADDDALIFLTSGTSGEAKFARLSHRNVFWNAIGAAERHSHYGLEDNRFLSFLPLAHSYEHSAGFIFPMTMGSKIFISRGPEHLRQEMLEARPTVITCVPRFVQMIERRMRTTVAQSGLLKRNLFHAALATGRKRITGEPLFPLERLLDFLLERLVRNKIRAGFGGDLRCILSAGAPLSRETILFFHALGVEVHQAYGQTEAAPAISMTRGDRPNPGSVGGPLLGVTIRLAEDGEVLVRGPNVMRGYIGDEASPVDGQGWLATGDIGRFDEHGDLWIVDRKRDIQKTPGGEMFAPAQIESALEAMDMVASAYVSLDEKGHGFALLTPVGDATEDDMRRCVDAVNADLPAWARIRRCRAIPPITIDDGLMTPTMKARRTQIFAAYSESTEP